MPSYDIINKATGLVAYTYTSDAPVAWSSYPFAVFDHVEQSAPTPSTPIVRKYGGRTELTHEEFRELFKADEQWRIDAFEAGLEDDTSLPDELKNQIRSGLKSYYAATFVDLKNPKVLALLSVFAGMGLIDAARITEILSG